MNILLSNDDSVYAPGIKALYNELSKIANVTVVAPEVDRSAAGKSLTISAPLLPKTLENGFIQVNGTPTDCVHLALTELLDNKPDIVVAGINAGANLGDDTLYSGTVAAATEGYFFGLPAIAFSLTGDLSTQNYARAAGYAAKIVENAVKSNMKKDSILNVNIPCLKTHPSKKEIHVTRLGQRHKAANMVKLRDPKGRQVYWIGPPGDQQDAGAGTDFYAIDNGHISITPLQMDLTRHAAISEVKQHFSEFNKELV